MGHLQSLALVPLKKRARMTVQEVRREKMIAALASQAALAEAEANGSKHVILKHVWRTDDNGVKQRVQREKHLRPWWFRAEGGQGLTLVVKYGSRAVELAKGKRAVNVESIAAIPQTIRVIQEAVAAGELDAAIEAVLGEVRGAAGKAR